MDDRRFDSLARSLAAPKTRRGLLVGLAALGAGLLGARAVDAQVTQAQCGNTLCAANPGVCAPGCVCCVWSNGNNRCVPAGACTGVVTSPTATTTAAPTTTTPTTTTTVAPTTTSTTSTTTTSAPTSTTTSTTAPPTTTTAPTTTTTTVAPTTTSTTTTQEPTTTTTTTQQPTTTTTTTTTTAGPTTTTTTAPPVVIVMGEITSADPTSTCVFDCHYDTVVIEHGGGPISLNVRGAASGGGTLGDPYLFFFPGTGPTSTCGGLEAFNDDGGCGNDSYAEIANLAAGTYAAVVVGYQCAIGTYTLERNTFVGPEFCP